MYGMIGFGGIIGGAQVNTKLPWETQRCRTRSEGAWRRRDTRAHTDCLQAALVERRSVWMFAQ